jgi:hypothetical protein
MAFHEQHPYLGVFLFLAMFGGLLFLQFYRFGYISAKVRRTLLSPRILRLHRRCSTVLCTSAPAPAACCTACCVLREVSQQVRCVLYLSKLWLARLRSWER